MNEQKPPPELGISDEDWKQTSVSVQTVVLTLYPPQQEVKDLKAEVAKLQQFQL